MSSLSNNSLKLQKTLVIPAIVDQVFKDFTKNFNSWWPMEYTWSQEKLDTIQVEPFEGGRCFERGPHNFEIDWGRVLTFEPPKRIVFTWQINYDRQPVPDPDKASEVEVKFIPDNEDSVTRIELEHRKFENHEEKGEEYREVLASPEGWPFILERFKIFMNNKEE